MSDLTAKIDVLDLIIHVLYEHEKKLDEAISKLDSRVNRIEFIDQYGKSVTMKDPERK
ncbi:MAG: hypothetical protein ABIJ47_14625 [Candidatus Bathyarchaeota archaeon]